MALSGPLKLGSSLIALIVSVFAPHTRANAQNAGTVGAVNPSASGTPPGAGTRTLAIGNNVVRNERLQTSAAGTLHVVLADRTTLNLGPNTDLVIDRLVYDPASGEGSLSTRMSKGLLRFVGGQTSHSGNATVQTPVGTIGIRGNMVVVRFDPAVGWIVTALGQGVITVRNGVSEVQITRPGFSVIVTSATAPIGPPFRESPAAIEFAFAQTMSRPGQRGGASRPPTNAGAAQLGIGAGSLPSSGGSALDYQSIMSIQPGLGRNSAQGRQPQRARPGRPPAETNPYGNAN
jgi:hypothetical protein